MSVITLTETIEKAEYAPDLRREWGWNDLGYIDELAANTRAHAAWLDSIAVKTREMWDGLDGRWSDIRLNVVIDDSGSRARITVEGHEAFAENTA